MLTPFGKALRQIRIEYGLKLLDVAKALGLSSAFLSALESGRKTIPDGFVTKISKSLPQLNAGNVKDLRKAADQTRKEVKVDTLEAEDREMVAAFARSISELSPEQKADIKSKLLMSLDGETPFRREVGMLVSPLSRAKITGLAEQVRDAVLESNQIAFPIIEFIELSMGTVIPDFHFQVRDCEEMGPMEGLVIGTRCTLVLREDVYEQACAGVGRARFTAAHELGHFLMHRNVSMARSRGADTQIFYDSEWQADTFAGALLMSSRHLPLLRDADHAAKVCGMSPAAAGYQLKLHGRKNG